MLINDKSILMNSKKLSHSSNNVANPVVIIPNQSNLLIDDLLNNNSLLNNGNKIEQDMSEIKYMKGYVNVLRERFTRKSLGADAELFQDRQKCRAPTNTSSEGHRRRSVSPFISTASNNNCKFAPNEPKNKLFASQDDLRNAKPQCQKPVKNLSHSNLLDDNQSIIKCTYSNEINQDELPKPNFVSSVKNLFEKQIKNDNVIHFAQYGNTNDRKEKNSPNKQLLIVSNQQAESLVEKLKQNGAVVYQHDSSSVNNQQTNYEIESAQGDPKTIEKTLEKTLDTIDAPKKESKSSKSHFKKHLSNATNINLVGNWQAPSNGPDKENKGLDTKSEDTGSILSFKERKELFSKKQPTAHSANHNYHPAHQASHSKRFKTDYSYSTPLEEEPKCNSISNDLNANSNNNNSVPECGENDPDRIEAFTADKILEQQKQKLKSKSSVKMKTYYGGEEVKDLKSLNLSFVSPSQSGKPMQINPVHQPTRVLQAQSSAASNASLEYFRFEFIGAGVKLDKSILIVNNQSAHVQLRSKKNACLKVNFTEEPETYEYPSFEFLLKEMGFDPLVEDDDDSNNQTETESQSSSTSSLSQFLPGRFSFDDEPAIEVDNDRDLLKTNIFDSNPTNFSKLSSGFNNFRPSWHRNYELGSMEHLNVKSDGGRNSVETSSSESLTNDILPSKDDDLKKWSSDMDSNILF